MVQRMTPMIHVPDVRAAVEWYGSLGFELRATFDDGGSGLSLAILSFGDNEIMFNEGGRPSDAFRREVDLYLTVDDVDATYHRLKDRVEVFEPPHDTDHGMRELIVRDLNRFWITFGNEIN